MSDGACSIGWGTHGCELPNGHAGHHYCCCECVNHPDPDSGCVGTYPYYGSITRFYTSDEHHLERVWSLGVANDSD